MKNMTSSRDVIIQLKEVWKEKKASGMQQSDVLRMIQENGDNLSKSSISRVFADGSENNPEKFRYEITLRPIAKALLGIETIEDTDDQDTQGYKSILKYKMERIEELEDSIKKHESALDREKVKYHEKLDKEREQFHRSLDFLKEQVKLKDDQIKMLMETNAKLMESNSKLTTELLECPQRKNCSK